MGIQIHHLAIVLLGQLRGDVGRIDVAHHLGSLAEQTFGRKDKRAADGKACEPLRLVETARYGHIFIYHGHGRVGAESGEFAVERIIGPVAFFIAAGGIALVAQIGDAAEFALLHAGTVGQQRIKPCKQCTCGRHGGACGTKTRKRKNQNDEKRCFHGGAKLQTFRRFQPIQHRFN